MNKVKFGYKLWAVVTFVVLSIAILLSGLDMSKVTAESGVTRYAQYIYSSGATMHYSLDDIPFVNNTTYSLPRTSTWRIRESYYDTAVVKIEHYYVGDDGRTYYAPSTGFIIGDHEIMTAAHCVYSPERGFGDHTNIVIQDATTITDNATKMNVISAHVPMEYMYLTLHNGQGSDGQTHAAQDYDYAILTVNEDLSQYGSYMLGMPTEEIEDDVPIHSLGYYGDTLKISHGTVTTAGELSLDMNLYSDHGSSGGPIYTESVFGVPGATNPSYQMTTYRTAVSIVHGGDNTNNYLNGVKIRPVIMQFAYDNQYLVRGLTL